MIEAGKEAGVDVTEWENQAQPSQWVQGINFAINEGFDLIDLLGGVDPRVIVPQIDAAKNAGIVVKTSHFYDLTQTPHESVDGAVPLSFYGVGQILANWAITQTDGKANVVIIGSDEIVPTAPFVQGIRDTLQANCPDCQEVAYINAPVPEWATKIQSKRPGCASREPGRQLPHPDLRLDVAVCRTGRPHSRQDGPG